MGTMNGGNVSSHAPAGRRATTLRKGGRNGEAEALVTNDGAVWTWEQLIEEFGPAVHAYGRARGVTDADDLVQEVFTAVVQKVPTFRGSSADLRSFVFTVAFRRIADRHRHAYRRRRLWREPAPLVEHPDESVLHADEGARAIAALDRLDERSQAVLRLRYIDGCDIAEVATLMNLSTTNVRAIQSRALKRLRQRFNGLGAAPRQRPLTVLGWSLPIATGQRLRWAPGVWNRRGGGLRRVRERLLGGAFRFGDSGVGAAGGASLVAAVSLTAASILGAGGSTATEHVAGIDVVTPQFSSPAAGATAHAPTGTALILPSPGPTEPHAGPLSTEPVGAGLPVPGADAADESAGPPAALDASADDPSPHDPDVAPVPGTSGPGVLTDRVPAPDVLAVPDGVVDQLGPGPLAPPTDAVTAAVTDLVQVPAGATITPTIDAPGEHTPAESILTAAPAPAAATAEVGPSVIDVPVAADLLALGNTATPGPLAPVNSALHPDSPG